MNQFTHILLVEDDPAVGQSLCDGLEREGYVVTWKTCGQEGIAFARDHDSHLIILDVRLPDTSGFDVCRQVRQLGLRQPVIMLTVRREEMDKVLGLEMGADDYVVKPFSPRELILRVRAILRRFTPEERPSIRWQRDGLEVDLEAHRVISDDKEIDLTATEFRLLAELIGKMGKVLTRDQLLDKVWGYQFDGYARTVDTHIRRLRQKIGPYAEWIETVRGVGYRFRD